MRKAFITIAALAAAIGIAAGSNHIAPVQQLADGGSSTNGNGGGSGGP
jgi:hypothetical protein